MGRIEAIPYWNSHRQTHTAAAEINTAAAAVLFLFTRDTQSKEIGRYHSSF